MSKMISVASGFQYSVNIGYDLNNETKIKNFIPTASAMDLLEDILLSTQISSTERARVLIGAYGKGKSHIMLMILSLLMKKDLSLFENTLSKIAGTKLLQLIENYYASNEKILPVIITGSNTSLTQAFLLALQRTLTSNDLLVRKESILAGSEKKQISDYLFHLSLLSKHQKKKNCQSVRKS